jgi:predicted alpha/beta-fold hydrolase
MREVNLQETGNPHQQSAVANHISVETVRAVLWGKPFIPHQLFTSGHAQTLATYFWPQRLDLAAARADQDRVFEVETGVRVLARCRWQRNSRLNGTLVLTHGLEGSSESSYMLGTADKAFRAGFNVIRLNMRTCGNTDHLTPTLYNSGLSQDVRAVINELISKDQLTRIFLAGFSMSGNIALKYAGEEGDSAPAELKGICAISASVDLAACEAAISRRWNWIYKERFMISLRRRMRVKKALYPELYDITGLNRVRSLRDFDNRFTAIHGGYRDAEDYYRRASARKLIGHIRKPTLIIHAQDDPFIPFEPLLDPAVSANPFVLLLAPEHGGHVGFLADRSIEGDRFWAQNRIVEFCLLMDSHPLK